MSSFQTTIKQSGFWIGRALSLSSVDNASRREPPIVTASRTGQLDTAALLAAFGADLEVRDGQVVNCNTNLMLFK